ncbi:COG4223 family protein [Roseovarius sp.]
MAEKKRSRNKSEKPTDTSAADTATDATNTSAPKSAPEHDHDTAVSQTSETSPDAADAATPEDSQPAEPEPEREPDADKPLDPETKGDETDLGDEAPDPTDTVDQEPEETPDATDDTRDTVEKPAPVAPPPEQVVVRKGGFFAMLLGGVAAAAIGFGMARYVLPQDFPFPASGGDSAAIQDLTQRIEAQSQDMTQLSSRIDTLADGSEPGAVTGEMDSLTAAIDTVSGRVNEIATRLDAFDARLSGLEARGTSESGDSQAALSAYEQELRELQASIAQQKAEISAIAEDARAKEESAVETAQAAMRRAALTRIQTALDAGTPFDTALADLEAADVAVPEALASAAAEGVPTQASLTETFPDAARRALAASRATVDDAGAGGLGGFLRSQLGARSLEPREGDDPDAVLSRAEAAAREGRLNDALAEIETLPEEGRAELSDWSAEAARRLDALAAAEALAQDLN